MIKLVHDRVRHGGGGGGSGICGVELSSCHTSVLSQHDSTKFKEHY
jgi:hypothetical protein